MIARFAIPALLAFCALSPAQAAEGDVAREELIAFADKFDAAQLTKNAAAMREMIADDLIFIESSGRKLDKKGFIDGWTEPGVTYEPIDIKDRTVVPLGPDAGIVGGDVVLKGSAGGKPFAARIRFSDTFRRIGGKWQAVYIQVTRVP